MSEPTPDGSLKADAPRAGHRVAFSECSMAPTAIVLHGTTRAGKSSIAKALQASAPVPAFHISLDAFVTMSNRRDMRSDAERDQAYGIHCENLRSTLAGVARTQFDITLDLVLRDQVELDACLQALRGRPTYLVRVPVSSQACHPRQSSNQCLLPARFRAGRNPRTPGGRSGNAMIKRAAVAPRSRRIVMLHHFARKAVTGSALRHWTKRTC